MLQIKNNGDYLNPGKSLNCVQNPYIPRLLYIGTHRNAIDEGKHPMSVCERDVEYSLYFS